MLCADPDDQEGNCRTARTGSSVVYGATAPFNSCGNCTYTVHTFFTHTKKKKEMLSRFNARHLTSICNIDSISSSSRKKMKTLPRLENSKMQSLMALASWQREVSTATRTLVFCCPSCRNSRAASPTQRACFSCAVCPSSLHMRRRCRLESTIRTR